MEIDDGKRQQAYRRARLLACLVLGWMLVTLASMPLLASPVGAQSSDSPSYWELVNRDIQAIDGFVAFSNRTDVSEAAVVNRADALVSQLDESIPRYDSYGAPEEGKPVTDAIKRFRSALADYRTAYLANDPQMSQRALAAMNSALNQLDAGISSTQQIGQRQLEEAEQADSNIRSLLVAGLVLSLGVSAYLFLVAQRQGPDPIGHARAFAYMAMFRSSLIVVGGFVVTLVTNIAASGGGTYIVAWGAMAFGAFALASRAYTYVTKVKPELDAAAKAKLPWWDAGGQPSMTADSTVTTPFPRDHSGG